MSAAARMAATPHLRAGEPVKRHDFGDDLAREHGVWTVTVVCGAENVLTTLTTKAADRTRCPGCIARAEGREALRSIIPTSGYVDGDF